MEMTPVTSSNIVAIGYDPATQTMHIKFKGGGSYSAVGVTAEEHEAFMAADSKGKHWHQHLKANHTFSRVEEPQ
jgi:KTSC domain